MISLRNSNYLKNFKHLQKKKLLKLEAAIVAGCNEKTPSRNNISGNSAISVIDIYILKDGISFLKDELS